MMNDSAEKLDRVSELVRTLDRAAAAIAQRHNVRSGWFEVHRQEDDPKSMIRVYRFGKEWHITWRDERGERTLIHAGILEKCAFLEVVKDFFEQYQAIADGFPSRIAKAISKGEKVAGWAAQMGYLDTEKMP